MPDGNHRASRKHAHDQTLRLAVGRACSSRSRVLDAMSGRVRYLAGPSTAYPADRGMRPSPPRPLGGFCLVLPILSNRDPPRGLRRVEKEAATKQNHLASHNSCNPLHRPSRHTELRGDLMKSRPPRGRQGRHGLLFCLGRHSGSPEGFPALGAARLGSGDASPPRSTQPLGPVT